MGPEARRWLFAPALAVAILVSLAAGCGQQTDPRVQQLLKDANAHVSKAAEVTKSIEAFNKQWQTLTTGQADPQIATELDQLFTTTKASETASLDETKAARDDYAKAAKLPLSASWKKYVDLRHQALDEQEQFMALELQAMDLRIEVAKGEEAGTPLQTLIDLERKISSLEDQSAAHAKRAAALHKEASDYYREHKLGG